MPIRQEYICLLECWVSLSMHEMIECKKIPQIYWNLLKQSSLVMFIALNSLVSPFMCRRDKFIPLHVTNLKSGIMLGFGGLMF